MEPLLATASRPAPTPELNLSGSIDLNNAMLQVVTSKAVATGTTFTIVQSGSGVTGTFDGLPEGSLVVAADGSEFIISYQADGGDAVVLTALGASPAVTGVRPATGPATGGTQVTITGQPGRCHGRRFRLSAGHQLPK